MLVQPFPQHALKLGNLVGGQTLISGHTIPFHRFIIVVVGINAHKGAKEKKLLEVCARLY